MQPYPYTKDIQGMNKGVYKKFFSQYDLVISLPYLFRLGNGVGRGGSILSTRQKLPHRLFLGITSTEQKGCHISTLDMYNIHAQEFDACRPYEYIKNTHAIESVASEVLEHLGISYGIEIGILAEYPKGYGTSFDALVITLLAVAIFVTEKKIPLESIRNYGFFHSHLYEDVCLLATYMKYLVTGTAGSCIPFLALDPQVNPVLQIGTIDFTRFEKNTLLQHALHLSQIVYPSGGDRKKDVGLYPFVGKGTANQLFRDVAIIHLGQSFESIREKESLITNTPTHQRVSRFDETVKGRSIDISLDGFLLSSSDVYGHMSTLLYLRLFQAIVATLTRIGDDVDQQDFFAVLKDMGFYHCLVERNYEMITLLYTIFNASKTYLQETCAFIPITTVKTGGTFLAVFPRHEERKTLFAVIDQLEKDYGLPATLLYGSWKEPLDFGGVTLHQYISESIFSEYISAGTVQLLLGNGTSHMGEYDAVLAHSALSSGITFDMIKRKVLIEGQKVNHKVICSQSATIEIMLYLCDHIGEFIPNRLLPASAYSKHKNEMISKILLPLQEILMKYCDEKLEVICTGTLYEWTICLKKKPQHIHLIHQVHP